MSLGPRGAGLGSIPFVLPSKRLPEPVKACVRQVVVISSPALGWQRRWTHTHPEACVHVSVTAVILSFLERDSLNQLVHTHTHLCVRVRSLQLVPLGAVVAVQVLCNPKEHRNPPEKHVELSVETKTEHSGVVRHLTFISHSMMETALSGFVSMTRSSYIWKKPTTPISITQDNAFTIGPICMKCFTFSL